MRSCLCLPLCGASCPWGCIMDSLPPALNIETTQPHLWLTNLFQVTLLHLFGVAPPKSPLNCSPGRSQFSISGGSSFLSHSAVVWS